GLGADLRGTGMANAINALQADPDVFLDWQIDTRNTRHDLLSPMRFERDKRAIVTFFRRDRKPGGSDHNATCFGEPLPKPRELPFSSRPTVRTARPDGRQGPDVTTVANWPSSTG